MTQIMNLLLLAPDIREEILFLPQFLDEIRPLLERRLVKEDWAGTIAIRGDKHSAGLTIRNGRVTVHGRPPARAAITLSGSDETITRIVTGIETPFKAYWNLDLEITPALNSRVRELLDRIFPRSQMFGWAFG